MLKEPPAEGEEESEEEGGEGEGDDDAHSGSVGQQVAELSLDRQLFRLVIGAGGCGQWAERGL